MKPTTLKFLIAMTAALAVTPALPAMADLAPPPAPEEVPSDDAGATPEPGTPAGEAPAEAVPATTPEAVPAGPEEAAPAPESAPASTAENAPAQPAAEEEKGGIGAAFWIAILAAFIALGSAALFLKRGKSE